MSESLAKNQYRQGEVLDLTSQGAGVIKVDQYPLFVEGVIPGEVVEYKVTKLNKKYGFGRLIQVLEVSPDRVEVTDPVGRQTGTMTLQHMTYAAQLDYKHNQVVQAFQRLGHFEDAAELTRPVIGMEDPWGYRNKAQIPVRSFQGQLETGFFRRNSHDLIPVEDYHIQHPELDRIILIVRDILREGKVPAYDEARHKGVIRNIIVKRGHYSGEVMVVLVSRTQGIPQVDQVVQQIVDQVPHLVSLVQNIQPDRSNVILGRDNYLLWGRDYYQDQMLGLTLDVGVHSFYQVNTPQAERLYQVAIEAAQLTGQETVLDAYCGIGSISLALAQHAKEVYAMEIVPEAIELAEHNAQQNQIANTHFQVGAAEAVLPQWQAEGVHFDVAVVDPPRKGLDSDFIDTLSQLEPDRIVYVSCNPATQARDCQLFADQGYQLRWIQPCDLFPQTTHVECVVLIEKEGL